LKSRQWTSLSDRIRVLSIADYNQDGILLVDLDGTLIVNLNDASDRGWGRFIRKIVRNYKASFLLKLSGFGDAEMIHLFDEEGRFISPPAAKKEPVGKQITHLATVRREIFRALQFDASIPARRQRLGQSIHYAAGGIRERIHFDSMRAPACFYPV
jgi:hypothetical protein